MKLNEGFAVVGDILTTDSCSLSGGGWLVKSMTETHVTLQRLGHVSGRELPPVTVYHNTVVHMHVAHRHNDNVIVVCSADYMNNDELNLEDKAIITEALQC